LVLNFLTYKEIKEIKTKGGVLRRISTQVLQAKRRRTFLLANIVTRRVILFSNVGEDLM